MKAPLMLKLFGTWALLMMGISIVGIVTAGNKEVQAILQPVGMGGFLLLIPFGLVWIWRQ